jgi:hypothetical protein
VGAGIFVSGVVDVAGVRFDPVVMRNMLYIYLKQGELNLTQLREEYIREFGVKLSWNTVIRYHYFLEYKDLITCKGEKPKYCTVAKCGEEFVFVVDTALAMLR